MSVPRPVNEESGDRAVAEVGGDLQVALARYMGSTLGEWRTVLADLEQRYDAARWKPEDERGQIKGMLEYTRCAVTALERLATDGLPKQDHLTPADFSWLDISDEWRHDAAAGIALWDRIKQTARDELREGRTGANAIESYNERPMLRAEYLAVWMALADGLRPTNGAERLLIDGMAQSLMMQRHWLQRMVQTEARDTIRRGRGSHDGYEPPRLSEAEAVDRAVAMQDRFQRQFLRLMKCYRDQRRLFSTLVIADGAQVNIAANGGQQLVATRTIGAAPRLRARPVRRTARPKGDSI
jgi:hypothetical protein